MEPKEIVKEKKAFLTNNEMELSICLFTQRRLIPKCSPFSSVGQWRLHLVKLMQCLERSFSDLWDKGMWKLDSLLHPFKSHKNHCFAVKNSRGTLFCKSKVAKAVQFHGTREDFFLSATRKMLQVFFSHNMSKWLTSYSFSAKRHGDRNNLCPGKNAKTQHTDILQLRL